MSVNSGKRNSEAQPDAFGCPLSGLDSDLQLIGSDIKMYRKRSGPEPVQVVMPPSGRGFLVGVSLKNGHERRISTAHGATSHAFEKNSIYVRGLDDDYKADLSGAFDFVLLEISTPGLQRIADNSDIRGVDRLTSAVAVSDPTLGGLASALFAYSDRHEPPALFVDQISHAIGAHLVRAYASGRSAPASYRRLLSPAKLARAKEMLWSKLGKGISIDDLATDCGMSRDAFLQAFKNTMGTTPYGWLSAQRMETARALLLSSKLSLVEIANQCGYSTQSQFTKTFTATHGESPGIWRKRRVE